MNNKLQIAQDRFIEGIGRLSDAFGLNSFVTKLYAYLYLEDRPACLDEIAETLGVSKGNVSINIRELEKWGAVRKVWIKGSRRDFYEAESDIKKVFLNKFRAALQRRLSEISVTVDECKELLLTAVDELNDDEKNKANGYRNKLSSIEELMTMASGTLALIESLIQVRADPALPESINNLPFNPTNPELTNKSGIVR